ncbi:hypothetical protein EDB19DRAFT_1826872 [Suillus lakei]|nr:hypothetical protein EDB19DRAFT_1826872 [Suillus lakei]
MTSYPVTEDLRLQNQGTFQNDANDDDSDLSSEEDFSPEPEDSIQGPLTGISRLTGSFVERGPQDPRHAHAPPKDNKPKNDQSNNTPSQKPKPRGTTNTPPRKPNPANYSHTGK